MKVHNKLPEPTIGQEQCGWTVVNIGFWATSKYYECQHICGNTRKFSSSEVWNKKFKPCKKCQAREIYRKNADEIIKNSMYRQYKWSAKQRKYIFSLSKKDFFNMIESKCFYCGEEPMQERFITEKRRSMWHEDEKIFVNGIDRVDNLIGYTKENCVPCCKKCNFAKSILTIEEFKEMIGKWSMTLARTGWK